MTTTIADLQNSSLDLALAMRPDLVLVMGQLDWPDRSLIRQNLQAAASAGLTESSPGPVDETPVLTLLAEPELLDPLIARVNEGAVRAIRDMTPAIQGDYMDALRLDAAGRIADLI